VSDDIAEAERRLARHRRQLDDFYGRGVPLSKSLSQGIAYAMHRHIIESVGPIVKQLRDRLDEQENVIRSLRKEVTELRGAKRGPFPSTTKGINDDAARAFHEWDDNSGLPKH
jgi:hypothetical protein